MPVRSILLGVVLSALVATASFGQIVSQAPTIIRTDTQRTITVTGVGEATGEPDMAQLTVGVVSQEDAASQALAANNEAMDDLIALLRELQIADRDIQTTTFSVSPQYQHDRLGSQPPRIVGYQVTNQVQVRIRRMKMLGTVLDRVVKVGANQIHGVTFSIAEPEDLLDQARRKAINNARHKAELFAEAAGIILGPPQQISEDMLSIPRPFLARQLRAEAADAVPIAPGEMTYTASITIMYAIDGGGGGGARRR